MASDALALPKTVTEESVLAVRHWTDELFSFRLTRPASFRFRSGEFVLLGLMNGEKPLLRAYSIASPSWDDGLDFYSIKVSDGPLTSRLQHVQPGDPVLLGRKPTGTLVLDALKPGRRLFLLSTGTGIAPFASLLREPETYEKFDRVVLTHTCRNVADLACGAELVDALAEDPLVGEIAPQRVTYYASTTREDFVHTGRITDLIASGKLFADLGLEGFDPASDRVMICGSMAMIADTKALCEGAGLAEGSNANPGDYVVEKAFAG
ncbi:ferredoxin--NADP+ reductase [Tistlia consotensis]|nr:ferredoxin--NADP reductase [Tistlia consotensis]SNR25761.1 ferredoxin--NADP+ reductase [Tistlia consotensis]